MKIYTGVSTNAGEKNMRVADDRAEATKLEVTEERKKSHEGGESSDCRIG